MNRGRILLVLCGTAFICMLAFTTISYFSYVEASKRQDFIHMMQYLSHASDLLKLKKLASDPDSLSGYRHDEYEVFLYRDKTGPVTLSGDTKRFALLEQLFPFGRLVQSSDVKGEVTLKNLRFYWVRLPVDESVGTLFLIHQNENLWKVFSKSFGPSLLVLAICLAWGAVWGSLILTNLFKKLNDKTDLLQSQTKEIIHARDAACAADRAKGRFVANISHELRTPLTAIIGFSESMFEDDFSSEQRKEMLETIIRNSNYLLHLINEVLDKSKIDEDKLKIEKIQFSPVLLLKDIENLIRQQIESKGLEFKVNFLWPLPETLLSDPLRVKQVILNLCANAIKFTEFGHIHITVSFNPEKEQWCIVVSDTGIGIAPEQQENIFTPFVQADISITRKYGGTGLGLALTKRLVELMGGEIALASEAGEGSQFLIELPTGPIGQTKMLTAEMASRIEANPFSVDQPVSLCGRVLVAEDAPDSQILVKVMLEKIGLSVQVVGDGRQAIEAAKEEAYDLILMDMQMPVMDGVTALQKLREKGFRMPVIALTANTQSEDKALCFKAGFDDFVGKPIRRRMLYQVLEKYLGEGRQLAKLRQEI